jgi:hypothetical protein
MKFLMYTILGAGLASTAACRDSDATGPNESRLTTDSSSYTAIPVGFGQVQLKVVTQFRNTTGEPIELPRCYSTTPYPIYGVELVSPSNSEGAAFDPSWACVGHDTPIVVAAQSVRTDTLILRAPNAVDGVTQRPFGEFNGRFRINIAGYRSNEFEIRMPPGGAVPYVPRDLSAAIQTDSLIVHLKAGFIYEAAAPLHVTIYNPRPDTIAIINCGGFTGVGLERRQDGDHWVAAWSAAVPGCFSAPIVIPPAGHYEATLRLEGARIGQNGMPRFLVNEIPGVYRLVYSAIVSAFTSTPSPKWGPVIPVELRRSNPFAIVIDP